MSLLFHRDAVVASLSSGSRGNCTYIGDHRSGVLVDCGLSTRQVLERLRALGHGDVRIDAVLVTHEHFDHVGAARVLSDRLHRRQGRHVPFYMTRGTRRGVPDTRAPTRVELIAPGQSIRVGGVEVHPYTIPHDTSDPVAYTVRVGDVSVGVITDLGRSTRLVEREVAQLDVAVLEFNHDVQMLMDGPYPWRLKQRVRGAHGHLSNEQAAELLRRAAPPKLAQLLLAHLSEENNTPEAARAAAVRALSDIGSGAGVHVAEQRHPHGVRVRPTAPAPRRRAPRRRRAPLPPRELQAPSQQVSLFPG